MVLFSLVDKRKMEEELSQTGYALISNLSSRLQSTKLTENPSENKRDRIVDSFGTKYFLRTKQQKHKNKRKRNPEMAVKIGSVSFLSLIHI